MRRLGINVLPLVTSATRLRLMVWLLGVGAAGVAGCDGGVRQPVSRPSESSITEQLLAVQERRAEQIEAAAALSRSEWESLRGLAGLRVLVLQRGVAGDAEAMILATLPDLERLVLRQSPLSDAGFAALAACRSLRDVNVPQAACTAVGIESLAMLANLQSLRLGGPNLTGPEVARAIAKLPHLRSLHLIDVAIGDDGLDALADLSTLRNLYLDGPGVSDAAWALYFDKRPGVHVHVDQAHHDRDPVRVHD